MRPQSFHFRLNLGVLAIVALTMTLAPAAEATNGYFTHGYGTIAKALAGAGVAMPQDTLAAGTNPAGLAFLGKRYDIGVSVFGPNRSYTVEGNPSGFPGTFGLAPGQGGKRIHLLLHSPVRCQLAAQRGQFSGIRSLRTRRYEH